MRIRRIFVLVAVLLAAAVSPAFAMGDPDVAALQVALDRRGLYDGTIDGERGPVTSAAVVRFQRRHGLTPDGVVGPRTRYALGRRGRPRLGGRVLSYGAVGWDVVALQFSLAWHGFPSGFFDGDFGPHVDAALRRYQEWAGLDADGLAGRATYTALRGPLPRSPLTVSWPLAVAVGDRFGPRGDRFHSGIDLPAAQRTPIAAARRGWVTYAGPAGDYGRLVVICTHAASRPWQRAHVANPRRRRPACRPRPASRARRSKRPLDRAPPPFRGPSPRRGRRSAHGAPLSPAPMRALHVESGRARLADPCDRAPVGHFRKTLFMAETVRTRSCKEACTCGRRCPGEVTVEFPDWRARSDAFKTPMEFSYGRLDRSSGSRKSPRRVSPGASLRLSTPTPDECWRYSWSSVRLARPGTT